MRLAHMICNAFTGYLDALLAQHPLAQVEPLADGWGAPMDTAFALCAAEAADPTAGWAAAGTT
jgi:hypothetical protein